MARGEFQELYSRVWDEYPDAEERQADYDPVYTSFTKYKAPVINIKQYGVFVKSRIHTRNPSFKSHNVSGLNSKVNLDQSKQFVKQFNNSQSIVPSLKIDEIRFKNVSMFKRMSPGHTNHNISALRYQIPPSKPTYLIF